MKTLEENVRMYVAALATSGNNFAVEGEYSPISEELKDEYVKSLMALISEAVNKARIDELATLKDYIAVEWKHNSDSWCAGADAKSRDTQEYIANRIEELNKTNTHMEEQ